MGNVESVPTANRSETDRGKAVPQTCPYMLLCTVCVSDCQDRNFTISCENLNINDVCHHFFKLCDWFSEV